MILHLCTDDKFVDDAISLFDQSGSGEHVFYVLDAASTESLRYIKNRQRVRCVGHERENRDRLTKALRDSSGIVLHGMAGDALDWVHGAPASAKVVWLTFGYDIYLACPPLSNGLYQPETAKLASRMQGRRWSGPLREKASAMLWWTGLRRSPASRQRLRAVARIDYCAPVVPDEWNVLTRIPGFRASQVRFNYGWVASIVPNPDENNCQDGPDILLGNSSSETNNHLDAFTRIKEALGPGTKVVVPLSYGSTAYRQEILRAGERALGSAFLPLVDFVPRDEYMRILRRCGTVVMNHHRQQAMGNIVAGLYLGARVFLPAVNPGFVFLRGLGVDLLPFDESFGVKARPLRGASGDILKRNREILDREYSWENSLSRARSVAQLLL